MSEDKQISKKKIYPHNYLVEVGRVCFWIIILLIIPACYHERLMQFLNLMSMLVIPFFVIVFPAIIIVFIATLILSYICIKYFVILTKCFINNEEMSDKTKQKKPFDVVYILSFFVLLVAFIVVTCKFAIPIMTAIFELHVLY